MVYVPQEELSGSHRRLFTGQYRWFFDYRMIPKCGPAVDVDDRPFHEALQVPEPTQAMTSWMLHPSESMSLLTPSLHWSRSGFFSRTEPSVELQLHQ